MSEQFSSIPALMEHTALCLVGDVGRATESHTATKNIHDLDNDQQSPVLDSPKCYVLVGGGGGRT